LTIALNIVGSGTGLRFSMKSARLFPITCLLFVRTIFSVSSFLFVTSWFRRWEKKPTSVSRIL